MRFFDSKTLPLFNSVTKSSVRQQKYSLFLLIFLTLAILAVPMFAQEDEDDNSAEAIKVFNEAQDAHEKGDLTTAIQLYEKVLKIVPEIPEAEYQRGMALLSLNRTAEAEKAFRRAIELREDWTLPMASLGSILVTTNRYDEAEKILTQAIEIDSANFPALAALTELRVKTKAAPAVLKELLAKLQIITSKANPTVSAWVSRAALERTLGDKTAAKNSLNRALSIEPKNKAALVERAETAIAESDLTGATEIARTLAQISPNSDEIRFLQARIFAADGKTAEASKILETISSLSPEMISLKNSISANSQTSVAELEKQLANDAKNATILGRLCGVLRAEDPTKALDYCRRAAETEPNNINHAIGFGAALVQAKKYAEAVVILRKLLQIAPDNYTVRANLATALFQLKAYADAKIEYQKLTEQQPDLAVAYYFLAICHDNLSEYLDAMANYQQFLKLADASANKLEIEKVNLRLPGLQKQIKDKKGKR